MNSRSSLRNAPANSPNKNLDFWARVRLNDGMTTRTPHQESIYEMATHAAVLAGKHSEICPTPEMLRNCECWIGNYRRGIMEGLTRAAFVTGSATSEWVEKQFLIAYEMGLEARKVREAMEAQA